jgi:hypothetical protein
VSVNSLIGIGDEEDDLATDGKRCYDVSCLSFVYGKIPVSITDILPDTNTNKDGHPILPLIS